MKLLYFSGSTLPSTYANAVHVMKMCAALAGLGHEVTLYAKAGKGGGDVFAHYGVAPGFKIIRSPDLNVPGLSGLIRSAFTLVRKEKADLIYGRDLWTMAAVAGGKTPIAFELHEIPGGKRQQALLRRILNASNLRQLVVITHGLKEDLIAFAPAFAAEKILVAADGADLPKAQIVAGLLEKVEGTDYQVGYGGSLYRGKGVELIVQIAILSPQTGFHIFGGPEHEKQKWLAQKIPANVRFYGHMAHGALAPRLAACDALIAPYMPTIHIGTGADISRWISPLKLFEYMALKKPILCSDLPVLREVMRDGENCLLVDPLQPQDWVVAIGRLKANAALATALGAAAYADLEVQYHWGRRAAKILDSIKH